MRDLGLVIERIYKPDQHAMVAALLTLLKSNKKPAVLAAGEGTQDTDVSLTRG